MTVRPPSLTTLETVEQCRVSDVVDQQVCAVAAEEGADLLAGGLLGRDDGIRKPMYAEFFERFGMRASADDTRARPRRELDDRQSHAPCGALNECDLARFERTQLKGVCSGS
nr:hypothetical protein [Sphingobium sp.]